jgi:NAD(P)-dependent dehydrogenase (short-subunit alcohol dehydrogenase family)
VDAAADQFLAASNRLDVLICNAGVMALAPSKTKDGYEKQFGINHVAHALLIRRLLPTLENTAKEHDVRILSLSSLAAQMGIGGINFDALKSSQDLFFGRWRRYSQSKLANVMYANELARRYKDLTVVSIHPGVIHTTELQTGLPFAHVAFARIGSIGQWISMEEGAYNTEWAATTEKNHLESGTFYQPVGAALPQTKFARDAKLCEQLWDWTQAELDRFETSKNETK